MIYDSELEFRQVWHEELRGEDVEIPLFMTATHCDANSIGIIEVFVGYYHCKDGPTRFSSIAIINPFMLPARISIAVIDGSYKATIMRAMEMWNEQQDEYTGLAIEKLQEKGKE